MNKNVQGLILEGISGTGKSSVLRALLRHDFFVQKPFFSSLVLSEHHTQRVLEAIEKERAIKVEGSSFLQKGCLFRIGG